MRVSIPIRYGDTIEVRVDADNDLRVMVLESDGGATELFLLRHQVKQLIAALELNVESVRESAVEL